MKDPLTNREKEILILIIDENTSRDIAVILQLSVRTVDTHRKHILRKTNSRSLIALFKYAIRAGLTVEYIYQPVTSAKNT